MALDLSGITNQGDFYSPHYLEELLENDLKGLLKRWQQAEEEHGKKPPYEKLESCAREFFRQKVRAAQGPTPVDRWNGSRSAHAALLDALGYQRQQGMVSWLDDGRAVPLIAEEQRDGRPYLWVVEGRFLAEGERPLDLVLLPEQLPAVADQPEQAKLPEGTLEDLPAEIFKRAEPPRWVVFICGGIVHLIERTKWAQGKCLIFDFDELLSRRQTKALQAAAALLARDALCPDDGTILHDTLGANSDAHAFAVSKDLKYGVRRAVELLANEYVWYQRNVSKQALFGDDQLAQRLKVESMRYLYRLLFLLYAEARGDELSVIPMKSEEYRLGYSFEALRDLEQVPLTGDHARNGYFLHESLEQLFTLVNEGHGYVPGVREQQLGFQVAEAEDRYEILERGFTIRPLHSGLFDKRRTPLLSSAKFRNFILQEVIQQLSLSREGARGHKQRGRISYAQLGLNQLGAVYEGLLAYSGFFARETLYEVKPAGSKPDDEKAQSYFIPESAVPDYEDNEFVKVEIGDDQYTRKRYEKGSFVFRLAGRDRQQSASYYTPEVLTRCVVKYALKELLKDKTATDILDLTICEMAMGSAAFVNEAIGQLADAYLERRQKELARIIPASEYPLERKKVMAHLALNNCYGVDLNPVATELAEVSLWLNIIHPGLPAPWFGLRLVVGNSLIGARHQVFPVDTLSGGGNKKPKKTDLWLTKVPDAVPLAGPRPDGTVYHFLVGDDGMAAHESDKVVKELARDAVGHIKKWRKAFNAPFTKGETEQLEKLSQYIDGLWQRAVEDRRQAAARCRCVVSLFGRDDVQPTQPQAGERELAYLRRPTGPYRRLKLVMDAWCALWFWPIAKAELLPKRDEWMRTLELLVIGRRTKDKGQLPFDFMMEFGEDARQRAFAFIEEHGLVNVDEVCSTTPWLQAVCVVTEQQHFHHWELAFGEVFADRGGFDLTLGNPPWVKVEWEEAQILADFDPRISLREWSASDIAARRSEILASPERVASYLEASSSSASTKECLNASQNYPLLRGMQTNLYKCFVTRGWEVGSSTGCVGYLHPDGIYDDSKGAPLRAAAYTRLRFHFQLINERRLFPEVDHHNSFSVNVYHSQPGASVQFDHMSNLFRPKTIDDSYAHDGHGSVPGVKNPNNDFQWDDRGHAHRVVAVDHDVLALFARLYDEAGTPALEARLPVVHSREIVRVLRRFANQPRRLGDIDYFASEMFHETNARKDGTIRRETRTPNDAAEWIFQGPHFFVATPVYQTPNEGCSHNLDYSRIDLTDMPDDFLPRTNYVPACSPEEYRHRTPTWKGHPVTEWYRHVNRRQLSPTGERTLINAIVPPGTAHVHTVLSVTFEDYRSLALVSGLLSSIICDFFVKSTGKGDLYAETLGQLPLPDPPDIAERIIARALRLNCLTRQYAALWTDLYSSRFNADGFATADQRVSPWTHLSSVWRPDCAVRTDFERRQALVELDVLGALALGLDLSELLTIYRAQFPVLQKYEHEDRYDQSGRLVPGEVLKKAKQEGIDINQSGPNTNWTDPKLVPVKERKYVPPFTRCDREADMSQAFREFERRMRGSKVA